MLFSDFREVKNPETGLAYFQAKVRNGTTIGINPLAFDILQNKKPIIVIEGGRMSGKSIAAAQAFVMATSGLVRPPTYHVPKMPIRVLVVRESKNSLRDSVMQVLWSWICNFDLQDHYLLTQNVIRHLGNGSEFVFRGIQPHRGSAVRSFAGFHYCWIEEGQEISMPVWEQLEPTIRRKDEVTGIAGRFVITLNRAFLTDAIDAKVIQKAHSRPDVAQAKVNYLENPFLDKEILGYIEHQKVIESARFSHTWLGEPDMQGHMPLLITPKMVTDCFVAFIKFRDQLHEFLPQHCKGIAGLDLAGQGENFNCLVIRYGPVVAKVWKWNKVFDHVTYARTFNYCTDSSCGDVYFDVSGVGNGFHSRYHEARTEFYSSTGRPHYPLKCVPENFGGAVKGKTVQITRGISNESEFQYRGDQLGQMLVIRMQNTQRLLAGQEVKLENCLFFSDQLDAETNNNLMRLLTQPIVEKDKRSRMHIKKMDKTRGQESPDEFDALRLAFAPDSRKGIRLSQWD